jgi:serine protease inhibitor
VQRELAAANMAFSFNLLKQLVKEQPKANVFISPYSASTALQMVGTGPRDRPSRKCRRPWIRPI